MPRQASWAVATAIRLRLAILVRLTVGALLEHRRYLRARHRLILSGQARTDALTNLFNRRSLDQRRSRWA
jgi:GGDEF domain-containing protein